MKEKSELKECKNKEKIMFVWQLIIKFCCVAKFTQT